MPPAGIDAPSVSKLVASTLKKMMTGKIRTLSMLKSAGEL
jgi:hypothetical protein